MASTVLLRECFGPLSSLGFGRSGIGGVVMTGGMQAAADTWYWRTSKSIEVSGSVFLNLDSKRAIVMGAIREGLPQQ